jgi:CheY-like chemotaxis protein
VERGGDESVSSYLRPLRAQVMSDPKARPGCRVLLVDDDDGVRRFLATVLSAEGCIVTQARDGQAALELLATEAFDAVVTDFSMPNADGVAVLEEAKARLPNAKRVLLSASHLDRDLRERAAPLAHEVHVKPVSVDDLRRMAERFCAPCDRRAP